MAFTDTRLGPGTLTLKAGAGTATEYGFQVSALTLTPAFSTTAGTPTLAEPSPPDESKTTYTLDGSAVNDFEAVDGLQRFAFDHDGEQVDVVWTPNTDTLPTPTTVTATVLMQAFAMGGKVAEQLVTDFSWPVTGKPVFAGGTTTAARGAKREAAA